MVKLGETQDITTAPTAEVVDNIETLTTTSDEVVENITAAADGENMNTTSTDDAAETTLGSEEAQTTSKRPKMIDYHREKAEKLFGILSPIQISRKPRDLDEIYNCECPRVYWPVCSVDDITYVNACIANCLKIKIRRPGPCVLYRREAV